MKDNYVFNPDIVIEVTNTCDMVCKGCYAPNILTKNENYKNLAKHLTTHELESVWPNELKIETVAIRGGEPSLNPDLVGILEFLKDKTVNTYVETNGNWIKNCDSGLLLKILEVGANLKLSLDKMHGVDIRKKNSMLKELVSRGVKISIAITSPTFLEFLQESKGLDKEVLEQIGLFWQKKASNASELIQPPNGVISAYGSLKKTITNKFLIKNTFVEKIVLGIFCMLMLCPQISFSGALKKISIGLASNFSDVSSSSSNPFGNYFNDGVELAIADKENILKQNNIDFKTIKFDYGTSQTRVVSIVKEALNSNVIAVLGYNYSSHALIAAQLHFDGKLPMITPSATAKRLNSFGKYVHPTCFDNSFMGTSLARLAKKDLKAKEVAIVVAKDCAYCQDLSAAFISEFSKLNGRIQLFEVLDSDKDFSDVAKKITAISKFDAILVPNHELTSAKIISAIVKMGIKGPFIGGDGWGDVGKEFFQVIGETDIEGYATTHWHQDSDNKISLEFIKKYKNKYGKQPNDTVVLAYDTMSYLIETIVKAKAYTRSDLEAALNKKNKFDGVSGTSIFNFGKSPLKSLVFLKIINRQFSYYKTVGPVQ